MKNLILFTVAVVLAAIMTPFAIIFNALDPVFKLLGDLALS
jgi:hypothetical protein